MITEDWLNLRELALVFYPHGEMAHLMSMRDVNTRHGLGPVCERVPAWREPWGTGSQAEWEKARELPLCPLCRELTDA